MKKLVEVLSVELLEKFPEELLMESLKKLLEEFTVKSPGGISRVTHGTRGGIPSGTSGGIFGDPPGWTSGGTPRKLKISQMYSCKNSSDVLLGNSQVKFLEKVILKLKKISPGVTPRSFHRIYSMNSM